MYLEKIFCSGKVVLATLWVNSNVSRAHDGKTKTGGSVVSGREAGQIGPACLCKTRHEKMMTRERGGDRFRETERKVSVSILISALQMGRPTQYLIAAAQVRLDCNILVKDKGSHVVFFTTLPSAGFFFFFFLTTKHIGIYLQIR